MTLTVTHQRRAACDAASVHFCPEYYEGGHTCYSCCYNRFDPSFYAAEIVISSSCIHYSYSTMLLFVWDF